MNRWQLYDTAALDTYVFKHNPLTMTSLAQAHGTKSAAISPVDGKVRTSRSPDRPFVWSFTGKVRTKAEYDALQGWTTRTGRVRLTDHLGRVHEVFVQKFSPTPVEKSGEGNGWFFAYTIETLYLRRIS